MIGICPKCAAIMVPILDYGTQTRYLCPYCDYEPQTTMTDHTEVD